MVRTATVDPDAWDDDADSGFWEPLARKRTAKTQQELVWAQYRSLVTTRPDAAAEFAEAIANAQEFHLSVRGEAMGLLAETAEEAGRNSEALDLTLGWSALDPGAALSRLTRLVIEHGSVGKATAAVEIVEAPALSWAPSFDFHRAALLNRAGRSDEGRALVHAAFDTLEKTQELPGRVDRQPTWSSGIDSLDREIFSLVRRGGLLRIVGLLDQDSPVTPAAVQAKLQASTFFSNANFEPHADRLIVDLADCSFDLRWSEEQSRLTQVQRTYDAQAYHLRRQIIEPPIEPGVAFFVLGIGDDASHPTIVNQLIELGSALDGFDCCIFLNRAGPLSERDVLPDVKPLDQKGFAKLVGAKLGPILKSAGFRKTGDTRFDLASGPLGHHAAITLRFSPSQRSRIETGLSIHYEELCDKDALNRDTKGNLRPTAFHVGHQDYARQYVDRIPTDPGIDAVEAIIDEIMALVERDWLPAIMTTRDPVAELERLATLDPETGIGQPLLPGDTLWTKATIIALGIKISDKLGLPDWVERFASLKDASSDLGS